MKRMIAVALLVAGIVLLVFGMQAMNSVEGEVSRFFRGAPPDRAVWMLVGGIVCAVLGAYGMLKKG